MADLTLRGQYEEATRLVCAGQSSSAITLCKRLLTAYPKHIATYSILAQASIQVGEHEQAAELLRRVLSADPEHALAYASLGAIYEEQGLLDEAINHLIFISPG